MNDLNFDIYAMTQPKSRHDIEMIMEEALAELSVINLALDALLAAKPKIEQPA